MLQPKVSIITVVFNGEKYIEKTIKSVLQQEYPNIEYVIIDGKSKDRTLEILEPYRKHIQVFVSEPDKGIYDAMNKGQQLATGEFLWFLNGGDYIPTPHTLSRIMNAYTGQEDVIYGHAQIVDANDNNLGLRRLIVPKKLHWKSFLEGMVVCHQAMLVKKSISEPYRLQFRIAADIDWAIRTVKKAKQTLYVPEIFCHYLEGGFSEQKRRKSLIERFNIMQEHYGIWLPYLSHVKIAWNLLMHKVGLRRNNL